jgi:hypothetical protein
VGRASALQAGGPQFESASAHQRNQGFRMFLNPFLFCPHEAMNLDTAKSMMVTSVGLARMFHELLSRDRGEGSATGQPQGVGPEAFLNSTSQGPTPEDVQKDGHIRARSRPFMKYPG